MIVEFINIEKVTVKVIDKVKRIDSVSVSEHKPKNKGLGAVMFDEVILSDYEVEFNNGTKEIIKEILKVEYK